MARRRRSSRTKARFETNVNPDLTSLINCMFLLLVFFMVATTFVNPKGLSVDLPGSGSSESRATKDMNIVMEPGGVIQVNGEVTERARLAEKIRQVMKTDNSKNVILEADRTVPHQEVVKVADIARGQGIEGVAFAKGGEG
jgi:biopolymer transport protein ExbD